MKGDSSVTKALLRMKGQLKLIKGVLYRKNILDNSAERKPRLQLILPKHWTKKVLNSYHDQVGHQGIVEHSVCLEKDFIGQACINKLPCMLVSAKIV